MQNTMLQNLDPSIFRGDGSTHLPAMASRRLNRQIARAAATARADGVPRADAVDALLAVRDVEQLLSEVIRDVFQPTYSEQYIPIGPMGVKPWMERYIQKRITPQGLLDYVNSAEMPWVSVSMVEITRHIRTLGAQFGWDWFEMQTAQATNTPLQNELAMALRMAADFTKDMIFISGDAGLPKGAGFIPTGLINDPDVPIAAAGVGTWSTATGLQIVADIAGAIAVIRNQNRRAYDTSGMTLLLPETSTAIVESAYMPNTAITVMQALRNTFPGMQIGHLPQLSTASAAGGNRAILYVNNSNVLEGVLPLDLTFLPEESWQLRVYVWGILRIVGLVVKQPLSMLYLDGL